MPRRDLSLDEQKNVRAYLQMLRVRFGNWRAVERSLPVSHSALNDVLQERTEVSVTIAFRIAKMLDVALHHVLTGTALPPGTRKHCGHSATSATTAAIGDHRRRRRHRELLADVRRRRDRRPPPPRSWGRRHRDHAGTAMHPPPPPRARRTRRN